MRTPVHVRKRGYGTQGHDCWMDAEMLRPLSAQDLFQGVRVLPGQLPPSGTWPEYLPREVVSSIQNGCPSWTMFFFWGCTEALCKGNSFQRLPSRTLPPCYPLNALCSCGAKIHNRTPGSLPSNVVVDQKSVNMARLDNKRKLIIAACVWGLVLLFVPKLVTLCKNEKNNKSTGKFRALPFDSVPFYPNRTLQWWHAVATPPTLADSYTRPQDA